jgi:hypothetical protein
MFLSRNIAGSVDPGSENSILDVCNDGVHYFVVLTLALFDIAVQNENFLFPCQTDFKS